MRKKALTIELFETKTMVIFTSIVSYLVTVRALSRYLTCMIQRGERQMNTLVIVLVAAVLLVAAYVLYGRWLANKWGIDPKAKTPVNLKMDRIMSQQMDGLFSVISFPLLQVQGL